MPPIGETGRWQECLVEIAQIARRKKLTDPGVDRSEIPAHGGCRGLLGGGHGGVVAMRRCVLGIIVEEIKTVDQRERFDCKRRRNVGIADRNQVIAVFVRPAFSEVR